MEPAGRHGSCLPFPIGRNADVAAVVEIVTVLVAAEPLAGVRLDGENVQVASLGNELHVRFAVPE
jgi:hypothetical protein